MVIAPCKHFGQAYGDVEGNTLKVVTKAAGMYICIIYGDRKDPAALADYNSHGADTMEYEFDFEKDETSESSN